MRRPSAAKTPSDAAHLFRRHFPQAGRALAHLAHDLSAQLIDRPAGGKRRAAAIGPFGVAHRIGVGHQRLDILGLDAQRLGQLHGQCDDATRRCR